MSDIVYSLPRTKDSLETECLAWGQCAGKTSADTRFSGFKNVIGAGDGCHIPICIREKGYGFVKDSARWRNRKGWTSINVLAVCRHDYTYCFANVGAEGSMGDARLLTMSGLLGHIKSLSDEKSYSILFDAAGIQTPNMLVPYAGVRLVPASTYNNTGVQLRWCSSCSLECL